MFGLHENADITYAQNETSLLFSTLLSLQPRAAGAGGGGRPTEKEIGRVVAEIEAQMPSPFDLAEIGERFQIFHPHPHPNAISNPNPSSHAKPSSTLIPTLCHHQHKHSTNTNENPTPTFHPIYPTAYPHRRFPITYFESMHTVLMQELARFNLLLQTIAISLSEISLSLQGVSSLPPESESTVDHLLSGRLPTRWHNVAYPSKKPLGAWIIDLLSRIAFFRGWAEGEVSLPVAGTCR